MNNTKIMELPEIVAIVTPGKVTLPNMPYYKEKALELKNIYENIVYSDNVDNQLKEMRADRAFLNKRKEEINQEKRRVKQLYTKELEGFESDCKELINILESPISKIDQGIKKLEDERRKRRQKEITDFFLSVAADIEEDFREEFYQKIYSSSWENATSTKKAYREGILNQIENYLKGLNSIKEMNGEEFEEDAIRIFRNSLQITDAISFISRMKEQKAELLRKERERIEREAREKAEREKAEALRVERERIEREAREKAEREKAEALRVERERIEREAKEKAEREKYTQKECFLSYSLFPSQDDCNKKSKPTLYICLENGILSNIYSSTDMEIVMVDSNITDSQELKDFYNATAAMNTIF